MGKDDTMDTKNGGIFMDSFLAVRQSSYRQFVRTSDPRVVAYRTTFELIIVLFCWE